MARRKVDMSLLQGLVQGAENQTVSKGNKKTDDPNFPVFTTPVNEDILVYIPKTNCVETENGVDMQLLRAYIHDYKSGKQYGQLRCISNLQGNPAYDALGYDGTCPACEATKDCWELYNTKLKAEADKLGVDVQNDVNDVLKPMKDKLRDEMEMRGAEEYVTFPIVIVPMKAKMTPSDDALENLKPVFVTWRKKRYEDNIVAALEGMMENPGHPAGMFWLWKFSYALKEGQQASARDSAKNAKYMPLESGITKFGHGLADACEESAKEFTIVKATEVIVANQFLFKEDLEEESAKVVARTRTQLELSNVGGLAQNAIGGGVQPQLSLGGGNPLDNFVKTEAPSIGLE